MYHILIVDDVSKNIQVVGNILKNDQYRFYFANNGMTALQILNESPIDLVLLDVLMPDMDGYEVCRKIKSNPHTENIPVIFITAKSDEESIVKGFESGGVDYVGKPFNSQELIARVKTHLKLRTTIQKLQNMLNKVEVMSNHDELTGLYNRRGFFTISDEQRKQSNRNDQKMLLVFVDLDNLKWINDNLGHEQGDMALIDCANVLRTQFRDSDIIARLGGDEFVALLLNTDITYQDKIREGVKSNIQSLAKRQDADYDLSMSIGIVEYDPHQNRTLDELIRDADRLMYQDKLEKKESRG